MRKCDWCHGDTETDRRALCKACKVMNTEYRMRIGKLFHTTPVPTLLQFRNLCMDLINYREHGGKDLPGDLDYQLARVKRYLKEE